MKRMHVYIVVATVFFTGCSLTPTRIDKLSPEDSSIETLIQLNGILVNDGETLVFGNSFIKPTRHLVKFTSIPEGPWEFDGETLFPVFNSIKILCVDSDEIKDGRESCAPYKDLKGTFIAMDCESYPPIWSADTYSERVARKDAQEARKKKRKESKVTVEDIMLGSTGAVIVGGYLLLKTPDIIINKTVEQFGKCHLSRKIVWFDHDKFFDTVKKTILKDYASINAYFDDITQASMAYRILSDVDVSKREEIETSIRRWKNSTEKLLPPNDSIDNYPLNYTPFSLVEIPRKADWSKRPADIEIQLLKHYKEQSSLVDSQIDFYNNKLANKYGIYINGRL